MPKDYKPTVVVVAGPNGSGKTSFLTCMEEKQRIIGEWINPDEIAQRELGGWNDRESTLKAAVIAEQRRERALAERRDFTFETVLSQPDKLDFLAKAKSEGYFVRAYYIGTEGPEINAARVARRVMQGGHTVDIGKIISRYFRSIANLPSLAKLADVSQIFDNSLNDHDHRHMFSFVGGVFHKQRLADREMPAWGWQIVNTMQAEHILRGEGNDGPRLPLARQIVASQHEPDLDRRVMLLERAAQGVAALQADVSLSSSLAKQAADLAARIAHADNNAAGLKRRFFASFSGVYRDHNEAVAAWNEAADAGHRIENLFTDLMSAPDTYGKLLGSSVLGLMSSERKAAVAAVTALVETGKAYYKAAEAADRERPSIKSSRLALINDPVHPRSAEAMTILASCDIAGLEVALDRSRDEVMTRERAGWVQTADIDMGPKVLVPTWDGLAPIEQHRRQDILSTPEWQQALFKKLKDRDPARASQWERQKTQESPQARRGHGLSM